MTGVEWVGGMPAAWSGGPGFKCRLVEGLCGDLAWFISNSLRANPRIVHVSRNRPFQFISCTVVIGRKCLQMNFGEGQEIEMPMQIKRRKWKWIGHLLRKGNEDIEREALDWNPQGKRRRGRPRHTWRRTVHSEAVEKGKNWNEVKRMAEIGPDGGVLWTPCAH